MTTQTGKALDYIKNLLDNNRVLFFPLTVGTNEGEATAIFFDGRGAMFIKNDRSVFREVVNTPSNDPRYNVKFDLDGNCENYTLRKA